MATPEGLSRVFEGHWEDLLGFVKKYLPKVSLSKSHWDQPKWLVQTSIPAGATPPASPAARRLVQWPGFAMDCVVAVLLLAPFFGHTGTARYSCQCGLPQLPAVSCSNGSPDAASTQQRASNARPLSRRQLRVPVATVGAPGSRISGRAFLSQPNTPDQGTKVSRNFHSASQRCIDQTMKQSFAEFPFGVSAMPHTSTSAKFMRST